MIHVDIKQLARFERSCHRITGDRRQAPPECRPPFYPGGERYMSRSNDATAWALRRSAADEQKEDDRGSWPRPSAVL